MEKVGGVHVLEASGNWGRAENQLETNKEVTGMGSREDAVLVVMSSPS